MNKAKPKKVNEKIKKHNISVVSVDNSFQTGIVAPDSKSKSKSKKSRLPIAQLKPQKKEKPKNLRDKEQHTANTNKMNQQINLQKNQALLIYNNEMQPQQDKHKRLAEYLERDKTIKSFSLSKVKVSAKPMNNNYSLIKSQKKQVSKDPVKQINDNKLVKPQKIKNKKGGKGEKKFIQVPSDNSNTISVQSRKSQRLLNKQLKPQKNDIHSSSTNSICNVQSQNFLINNKKQQNKKKQNKKNQYKKEQNTFQQRAGKLKEPEKKEVTRTNKLISNNIQNQKQINQQSNQFQKQSKQVKKTELKYSDDALNKKKIYIKQANNRSNTPSITNSNSLGAKQDRHIDHRQNLPYPSSIQNCQHQNKMVKKTSKNQHKQRLKLFKQQKQMNSAQQLEFQNSKSLDQSLINIDTKPSREDIKSLNSKENKKEKKDSRLDQQNSLQSIQQNTYKNIKKSVKNSSNIIIQEKNQDRSIDKYNLKQIPSYSTKQIKFIEQKISKIDQIGSNEDLQTTFNEYIIWLLCWIWQAQSLIYQQQIKNKKKMSSKMQSQQIDALRCLRKLIEIYAKSQGKLFNRFVFTEKIQKGIKRQTFEKYFQNNYVLESKAKVSKSKQNMQEQQINYQVGKEYEIFKLFRKKIINNNEVGIYQQKVHLTILLMEAIIYNYDMLRNLEFTQVYKINAHFKSSRILTQQLGVIEYQSVQNLMVFTFAELDFIVNSNFGGYNFMKNKKASEIILWNFFTQWVQILLYKMKKKQFDNNSLSNAQSLQTAYHIITELTHYIKRNQKYFNQLQQISTVKITDLIESFIQRAIQFNINIERLKQKQSLPNQEIQIDTSSTIFHFADKFNLLLYDWILLKVKCTEIDIFSSLVKKCQKSFFKNIQKHTINSVRFNNNLNEKYKRFTIHEASNQLEEEEDKSTQKWNQSKERNKPMTENINFESFHRIGKFVSTLHMNFFVFQQFIPKSVRNKQKKQQRKKENQIAKDIQIFLLILINRDYILKLLQQIQFIEAEQLSPQIGKGLIKLCLLCHKFKGVSQIQRFLKEIQKNTKFNKLLSQFFNQDQDYQRRLSISMRNTKYQSNRINIRQQLQKQQQKNSNEQQIKEFAIKDSRDNKTKIDNCELTFFQIINTIEKKIVFLKLQTYLDQLLERPQIFRIQVFYQTLLKTKEIKVGRKYLTQLMSKWIDHELRFFNIIQYYEQFVKNCLGTRQQIQISHFVDSLNISKIFKLHLLIFKQSFTQHTSFKVQIPQSAFKQQSFSTLTSCGFQQKTFIIDNYFPQINQFLLWRHSLALTQTIKEFNKYISTKIFFTLISEKYSRKNKLKRIIEDVQLMVGKFRQYIQKEKVDECGSIFHFLSLALFSCTKNKQNESKQLKNIKNNDVYNNQFHQNDIIKQTQYQCNIIQIISILHQFQQKIVRMWESKQNFTIKILMKKGENKKIDQVQEFKHNEVRKALNKSKNIHHYFIKNITIFFENINYTRSLLKKIRKSQDLIQSIKKFCQCDHLAKQIKSYQALKAFYTPKTVLKLSSISSQNIFQDNLIKQLIRYKHNPQNLLDKYELFLMLKTVLNEQIEQKIENQNKNQKMEIQNKSKTSKNSMDSKARISIKQNSAYSVQNILLICIQVIKIDAQKNKSTRQCQILKQKLTCLETLQIFHRKNIKNHDSIKVLYPNLIKKYKKQVQEPLAQILIKILMNNSEILGKQERQLILAIRLKALDMIIQNYRNHQGYKSLPFKFFERKVDFWFVIFSLSLEKSQQIRLLILNSCLSNCNLQKNAQFKKAKIEIIALLLTIAALQPSKKINGISKKWLEQCLKACIQASQQDVIINSIFVCVSLVVNFITMHTLQKKCKKINEKEIYSMIIDLIFGKAEMQNYLFGLIQYFEQLLNDSPKQFEQKFNYIKWNYDFNIQIYNMMKNYPYKNLVLFKRFNPQKQFQQVLNDINANQTDRNDKIQTLYQNQTDKNKLLQLEYQKRYPESSQVFFNVLKQSIQCMASCFKQRAAKVNRKNIKTKHKIIINFGLIGGDIGIFSSQSKNMKTATIKQIKKANKKSQI